MTNISDLLSQRSEVSPRILPRNRAHTRNPNCNVQRLTPNAQPPMLMPASSSFQQSATLSRRLVTTRHSVGGQAWQVGGSRS